MTPGEPPAKSVQVKVSLLLALAGTFASWMLSYGAVTHVSLPCGEDGGCDIVALSPASHLAGIPIAVFGLGAYMILAVIAVHRLKTARSTFQNLGYAISVTGAAISLGLTYYSVKVIQASCNWCIASNMILCLTALNYALEPPKSRPSGESTWVKDRPVVIGMTIVTLMAMIAGPLVAFRIGNHISYDVNALLATSSKDLIPEDALIYAPAAYDRTVIVFVDMQCQQCHEFLPKLYQSARAGRVRIVLRHFPLRRHPESFRMAVLTEEIAQKGEGWPFLLQSFRSPDSSDTEFRRLASQYIGSSKDENAKAVARVRRDLDLAHRLKIHNTPAIIVVEQGNTPQIFSASDYRLRYGLPQ